MDMEPMVSSKPRRKATKRTEEIMGSELPSLRASKSMVAAEDAMYRRKMKSPTQAADEMEGNSEIRITPPPKKGRDGGSRGY